MQLRHATCSKKGAEKRRLWQAAGFKETLVGIPHRGC